MSDSTVPTPKEVVEGKGGDESKFTPPGSQADLDRIVGERLAREREKFSDYDELKHAASRLAEIEEANKTEAQKQQEALAAAQSRLAEYEQREQLTGWKQQVSTETGVPAEVLAGNTLESLQAHAEALRPLIQKAPRGPIVPSQGDAPSGPAGGTTADAFAAAVEPFLNP